MSVAHIDDTPSTELLRETNHRIANHLSLLVGMIQTQASAVGKGPDLVSRDQARALLQEAAGKVVSVSHLHRRLSNRPIQEGIHVSDYLIESTSTLISSLGLGDRIGIVQNLNADCVISPEQAQKVGLMVNEIVMNAVKHAHPTGIPVQISIGCHREANGRFTIEVADDGVGLPEGSNGTTSKGGVGFRLIRSLAQSLDAELRVDSDALGLTFRVTLPPPLRAVD